MDPSTAAFDDYQPRTVTKSQSGTLNTPQSTVTTNGTGGNSNSNGSHSTSTRPSIQKSYSEQEKHLEASSAVRFQISPREVGNINEIRRLVREQSNVTANSVNVNVSMMAGANLDDDDLEVPIRKFTPLPDIPRSDDTYYRTESKLIRDNISSTANNEIFIESRSGERADGKEVPSGGVVGGGGDVLNSDSMILFANNNLNSQPFNKYIRKETRYHFGGSSNTGANKVGYSHRLPALEKNVNHTINNTMDLDEDLPMNPNTTTPEYINQRMIYTSPGDRVISPIKRPQAPSPAASAYRRKSNKAFNNSQSDSDNDLIIT
jgi:hypothetical protein